jgi:outer membrane receptor protein involved in Fe transport
MKKSCFLLLLLFTFTSLFAQQNQVQLTAKVVASDSGETVAFANVLLLQTDEKIYAGTITNENGRFTFSDVPQGNYLLQVDYLGYKTFVHPFMVGRLSAHLDLGTFLLEVDAEALDEVVVMGRKEGVSRRMDKQSYTIADNVSQTGGSVLQAMQNLPGITTNQQGKILLRGSEQVAVLIDGKQSAITGTGVQENLDNILASAIERIEIINNPSAKYDSNAGAGIINIVMKKEKKTGWNGRAGLVTGLGSLSVKRENLSPEMIAQYRYTPKLNPSFSVNFRKDKFNFFANADFLVYREVAENLFTERNFSNGEQNLKQQFLENKQQQVSTLRAGADWTPNERHSFTFSTYYFRKYYNDFGNIPYIQASDNQLVRLWDYDEEELVQIYTAEARHEYHFEEPGHLLSTTFSYAFKRKEEGFFFNDIRPETIGSDTTALVADQQIVDLTVDYTKPHKAGKIEAGIKYRWSQYPNDIIFKPGINSVLDLNLQGTAEYRENIAAAFFNYFYEKRKLEVEAGLRVEYAAIDYLVDPNHAVYSSDGFDYFEFLPAVRFSWLADDKNTMSVFLNRRVDRPEEKNLRVFPSYADPEILRLGNPGLLPQFTNTLEVGYRHSYEKGSIYLAVYHKAFENLLTAILTAIPSTGQFAEIDQNAGRGSNTGTEFSLSHAFSPKVKMNWNANYYHNVVEAFQIVNAYPEDLSFSQERQTVFTGNVKWNTQLLFPRNYTLQSTFTYLAKDIIPQGEIKARYAFDMGIKKSIQQGKGELFLNATDIFNTFQIKTIRTGTDFVVTANNLFETQVVRVGYQYRF